MMTNDQDRLYATLERHEGERLDRRDASHALARRNTAATRARLAATARLIMRLLEGPMERDEIAVFLHFSPSGARKYANVLIKAGVIAIMPTAPGVTRTYQIASAAAASDWLAAAAAGTLGTAPASRAARRTLGPGVHLMDDDTPFPVKRSKVLPIERDPLVAALFGHGPARTSFTDTEQDIMDIQIRPRTPPAPPAPGGTPATATPAPFDWHGGRIDWTTP